MNDSGYGKVFTRGKAPPGSDETKLLKPTGSPFGPGGSQSDKALELAFSRMAAPEKTAFTEICLHDKLPKDVASELGCSSSYAYNLSQKGMRRVYAAKGTLALAEKRKQKVPRALPKISPEKTLQKALEIAREIWFGVNEKSAQAILGRAQDTMSGLAIRIFELNSSAWSTGEISQEVKRTPTMVSYYLRQAELKIRTATLQAKKAEENKPQPAGAPTLLDAETFAALDHEKIRKLCGRNLSEEDLKRVLGSALENMKEKERIIFLRKYSGATTKEIIDDSGYLLREINARFMKANTKVRVALFELMK
ncbi:Sigma-70, region 4 [Candidatus Gugararchaeum adminiculabundum]|nr:Sigma-70, region 4 [Candidatus Gugararchaeum adminiculabundum]